MKVNFVNQSYHAKIQKGRAVQNSTIFSNELFFLGVKKP